MGVFMAAVVYPVYGMWVWGGGWLSQLGTTMHLGHGVLDFAGSSVVHAVGGFSALAGAVVMGPRIGKFKKDGTPVAFPGHHIPMAILGTIILFFGWFGFNGMSTLAAGDLRFTIIIAQHHARGCCGNAVGDVLRLEAVGQARSVDGRQRHARRVWWPSPLRVRSSARGRRSSSD